MINLTGIKANEVQVELKFTNHGAVAAEEVMMNYQDGGYWSVHPLVEAIGVIPAQSSVTVPVVFRRITPPAVGLAGRGRLCSPPGWTVARPRSARTGTCCAVPSA
ncbi:MAG: hypothetical protein H7A46_08540 [Verrucomicrobiales bacterium]|nr:hypothetical protein [Verrucomicrobiales bacterium]